MPTINNINNYADQSVFLIVEKSGSSADSSGSSGLGGHTLLAMKYEIKENYTYYVFHLVGVSRTSSGDPRSSMHVSLNPFSTVLRLEMRGGIIHNTPTPFGRFRTYAGVNYHSLIQRYHGAVVSNAVVLNALVFRNLFDSCNADVGQRINFSLIFGAFNWGQNCITWAYNKLRTVNVNFDPILYWQSFYGPYSAIQNGGRIF